MIFSLLPVDIWRRNYNIFQFIEQFIITALTTGAVIFSVVIFEMCLTL